MTHTVPSPAFLPQLLASCRELTDHLSARTFSHEAATDDEDAVIAIERAERLLAQAAARSPHPSPSRR